ncbi:MAG: ThuA domain-containing protein [Imperialibacter sp.]|uniref:ThuA domain-containing protein n=1 Tax=Imperialibacter sp. TaxID=2038411 RepID=UPI003A875345
MMNKTLPTFCLLLCAASMFAQDLKPFELTDAWLAGVDEIAPSSTTVSVRKKKTLLIFSLHTGFEHWTIPHTEAVMKLIAEKSGAFKVVTSKDISVFEKDNLKNYDAVVLNNNCSISDERNIFWDVLKTDSTLTEQVARMKAKQLEDNLLSYVDRGGGLVVLHGAITMENKSDNFSQMVGGSFDYHPKQQNIAVKLVDPKHPMVQAFEGEGFEHIDEAYIFNNAYSQLNFHPLLYMEADKISGLKEPIGDNIKYISWIKRYGKGHVFYSSPSHNAQAFGNPKLLRFFLDGMQYAVGDLKCDDSPMK